jgi:hypothetical protein
MFIKILPIHTHHLLGRIIDFLRISIKMYAKIKKEGWNELQPSEKKQLLKNLDPVENSILDLLQSQHIAIFAKYCESLPPFDT